MNFIFVSVCILKKNDKILFTKRPIKKYFGGYWEFPGGKLKELENFQDAAVREMKEELGILVNKNDLKSIDMINHSYDNKNFMIMNIYLLKKWQRRARGIENQELEWINLNEEFPKKFLKGGLLILKRLKRGYYNL